MHSEQRYLRDGGCKGDVTKELSLWITFLSERSLMVKSVVARLSKRRPPKKISLNQRNVVIFRNTFIWLQFTWHLVLNITTGGNNIKSEIFKN